jgi:LCP family protein required for cell wall assembly
MIGTVRRKPFLWGAIALTTVLALLTVALLTTGIFAWRHVNRVSIGTAKTSTNSISQLELPIPKGVFSVLIASVGARGVDAATGKKIGVPDIAARGGDGLTDLLMEGLVNVSTGSVSLLSIPRDTWIDSCQCKINALYNLYGATRLVDEVSALSGERPQHLLLVNFEAFTQVIDAVGGVNVYLPRTIRDADSHLRQLNAGCQHLDGVLALAYVRSRHTQSLRGGIWFDDNSASDFGRIERQHQVLSNLANRILSPTLPFHLTSLINAAGKGVTIDDGLGLQDAIAIAKAVAGASKHNLHAYTLPSRYGRVGDASVVFTQMDLVPAVVGEWETTAHESSIDILPTPISSPGVIPITSAAAGAWTTGSTPNPAVAACASS